MLPRFELHFSLQRKLIILKKKKKLKKELQPHYHEKICGDQKEFSF